jgi:hypothetical protein
MTDPNNEASGNKSNTGDLWAFFYLTLGVPALIFIFALPFWEDVGRWPPLLRINEILAPKIAATDYPWRRFLIGAAFLNYVAIITICALMMFSCNFRKVSLALYDALKFFRGWVASIFFLSFAVFTWVSFFVTDDFLSNSGSFSPRSALGRIVFFVPVIIPLGVFFALTQIVGITRDAWRKLCSILKFALTRARIHG